MDYFRGLPGAWPIGSRDRSYRLAKLVEALLVEDYDVVALQEVEKCEFNSNKDTFVLGLV